ncbi:TPA: hypothetical protein N0F65_001152 [Lagenidium giganteum]|uniref:Uncharacterized protein n=1 Tax=Lagenidium giganteum TaxID=4803 RepID=A0AAV2YYU8_9STRA|nr:TPA: hypothetical protein N0F65_001152 [Lagenidium giganteum]
MNILTQSEIANDGAPLLRKATEEDEEEYMITSFTNVQIHLPPTDDLPLNQTAGTLYVTSKRVVWVGDVHAARVGYGWDMRIITLHAISRDVSAFPEPCLYCQLDSEDTSEVRFVPSDANLLQEVYTAFSKAAELNPDDDEDDDAGMFGDEMGDEDGWIYNEEEVANGARAASIAAHLDSILQIAPGLEQNQPEAGQFDDADEAEDDCLL